MRTVVLLGTSHPLQCGTQETTPHDALDRLLRGLCAEHGIQVIAEEIDLEGLTLYGVTETVGARVCQAIGIESAYCDAGSAERIEIKRQLPPLPPIDPALPSGERLALQLDAESEQLGDAREDFWIEKILQLNRWPLLFICGANHFNALRAKLVQRGIFVVNGPADWKS